MANAFDFAGIRKQVTEARDAKLKEIAEIDEQIKKLNAKREPLKIELAEFRKFFDEGVEATTNKRATSTPTLDKLQSSVITNR